MAVTRIGIYGAGGLGKEIRGIVDELSDAPQPLAFAGYFDDGIRPQPAATLEQVDDIVVAIALPQGRKKVVESLTTTPFAFRNLIHPSVRLANSVTIGKGCILCAGVRLTVDITIGAFVIINLNATIGHDVRLGNFVSIMPGANLSGNVTVDDHVFIGTGATILQGLHIGKGAVIGAGAVVTKNVAPGITVVGVPARPMTKRKIN